MEDEVVVVQIDQPADVIRENRRPLRDRLGQRTDRVAAEVEAPDIPRRRHLVHVRECEADLDVRPASLSLRQLLQDADGTIEVARSDRALTIAGGQQEIFRVVLNGALELLDRAQIVAARCNRRVNRATTEDTEDNEEKH